MILQTKTCKDCIFRESDFDPNSIGHDTIDSCSLLRKLILEDDKGKFGVSYHIDVYDSYTITGEEFIPESLNKRLDNCPLDKEEIIIKL